MVKPSNTLAIILGASSWPKCAEVLPASKAFEKSAIEMKHYLTGSDGMAIPSVNVLDLFDTEETPSSILDKIGTFLQERVTTATMNEKTTDLVLYYTGHGGFSGPDKTYFLAIRSTKYREEGGTSIRMVDLATSLKRWALDLRRYIILDCCFSAAAYKSAVNQAISAQTLDAFPMRGTALLCSSSPRTVSVAKDGYGYTMFSGALLQVLRIGEIGQSPDGLSLHETGSRVRRLIQERHADDGVRPEVHSPDEHQGDVANIPLFPNKALSGATWRAIAELSRRIDDVESVAQSRHEGEAARSTPALARRLISYVVAGLLTLAVGTIYFATRHQLDRKFNTQNCLATHDILVETCRRQIDQLNFRIELLLKELSVTREQGKLLALTHGVEELRHNRDQLEVQKNKANAEKSLCYYPDDPTRPTASNDVNQVSN